MTAWLLGRIKREISFGGESNPLPMKGPLTPLVMRSSQKDETCATVDTGCQRMAIGVQTLRQLVGHLPDELGVQLHQQEHRFRSAHGRSSTNHVASVPTSLGFKGSLLKPAGFENDESKHAPFLISPPFLLFCRACVVLGPPKRF